MSVLRLRATDVSLFLTDCHTRLPFRFGIATLEHAPLCLARLRAVTEDGERVEGFSSDLLVPRWFRKDPQRSVGQDIEELLASARGAADALTALPEDTVFGLWRATYAARSATEPVPCDRLVPGFGVALVERALIDAACRARGISFFQALKSDVLGFRPNALVPALEGVDGTAGLVDTPTSVHVRHTVGLADPLEASDVSDGERPRDGLPVTFEEDLRRYGLTHFKLKVVGRVAEDAERLGRIARILRSEGRHEAAISLDGNEQFASLEELATLLERLEASPEGAFLLERLTHIEQPLARAHSFDPERLRGLERVIRTAPLIIDEADYGLEAFPRAIACGYDGVSIKNCKGVFRALLNRVLASRDARLFQTGEDLTNLPLVALQQDLATMAALGMTHVERNGHHYFSGLRHLPPVEVSAALERHGDLYEPDDEGAVLSIRDGQLALGSLACQGYAFDVEPRTTDRVSARDWRP